MNFETQTLTCVCLPGGSSRSVWIQPCCDSSCPGGRGFLWEERSPGQSGPLWTCSRHSRIASKQGNTQITRPTPPASLLCLKKTHKRQDWGGWWWNEDWKQKKTERKPQHKTSSSSWLTRSFSRKYSPLCCLSGTILILFCFLKE